MPGRKFLMIMVLAALMLGALAGGAQRMRAAGPNVMQNGGFETATNFLPDFWVAKKLKLNATDDGQDCTTATEGACSMRFKSDGNGSKLIQTISGGGSAGENYLLTFDSMGNNAKGDGRYAVWVKIYHADGSKIKHQFNVTKGTTPWTAYQMAFTTDKNWARMEVHIRYTLSRGMAWFDNFVLATQ